MTWLEVLRGCWAKPDVEKDEAISQHPGSGAQSMATKGRGEELSLFADLQSFLGMPQFAG